MQWLAMTLLLGQTILHLHAKMESHCVQGTILFYTKAYFMWVRQLDRIVLQAKPVLGREMHTLHIQTACPYLDLRWWGNADLHAWVHTDRAGALSEGLWCLNKMGKSEIRWVKQFSSLFNKKANPLVNKNWLFTQACTSRGIRYVGTQVILRFLMVG